MTVEHAIEDLAMIDVVRPARFPGGQERRDARPLRRRELVPVRHAPSPTVTPPSAARRVPPLSHRP